MNKFEPYINWLFESLNDDIIVLFPGSFKPLTHAHVDLIKSYVNHPNVKEVKVLIGPGVRNNITQNDALQIAHILLADIDNVSIEAVNYPNPIMAAYEYIMNEAKFGTYALAASKKEDDYKRVEKFVREFSISGRYYDKKSKNVKVIELFVDTEPRLYKDRTDDLNGTPISASVLRRDILNNDFYNFETNYPELGEYETRELWKILKPIVKENLNEKFTQDSDPIYDLGIGLQKQIDDWIKTTDSYKIHGYTLDEDKLWICAINGKTKFVEYLLAHGHKKNMSRHHHHAIKWAAREGYAKIVKMLLDAGEPTDFVDSTLMGWAEVHNRKRVIKIIEDHIEKKKKKVNEKFTQDSDPIDDLGIGIVHEFNKFMDKEKSGAGWGGLNLNDTETQLRVCAHHNKEEFIDYILFKTPNIHDDENSACALRNAARNKNESMCLKLIKAGANIASAIREASIGDEEQIIEYLRNLKDENINESLTITPSKNIHMTHIEDLVLLSSENNLDWMLSIIKKLRDKLKGSTSSDDVKLSLKFDGSPAVFCWTYFNELKKPGVAIKSLFAKNPKILYTNEDVDKYYSEQTDLANKLKLLLKYIPSLNIPKNEIWQGDLLFDKNTLKDDGNFYSFHPNTIVYKVSKDSEIGKEIAISDIGLVWHTKYIGTSLNDAKAIYNVDLSKLNKNPKVFMADPYIASLAGYVTLTENENKEISDLIEDIEKIVNNLNQDENYDILRKDEDVVAMFTLFQNYVIKKSLNLKTPQDYIENFVMFIDDRYKSEAEKRKEQTTKDKIINKGKQIIDRIDDLYQTLQTVISLLYKTKQIKNIFIKKLNHIGKFEKYLETKEGKFESTSEEGFAVSDINGNIVKLVDREQFSYANFSPDIIKGWTKK